MTALMAPRRRKMKFKFKTGDRVKLTGPAMELLSRRNPGYRGAGKVVGTSGDRVVIRYPNLADVECIPRFLKRFR